MIKGTNADCKILNISVSETTATITLLFFATSSTSPSKSFQLYIQDANSTEKKLVNNYVYWVDRINNYNFDANNIDTNKYKEVLVNIDITNNNTSAIQENHWTRECYLMLCDTSKSFNNIAWSSDKLSLISDEFEIPSIKNIQMFPAESVHDSELNEDVLKVGVSFMLEFTSEKDFNYNNKNFLARINIRNVFTNDLIETKLVAQTTSTFNQVITDKYYSYNEKVVIEILITDNKENIFYSERKIFTPRKKYSKNTYVKTKSGIKKVYASYVNTEEDVLDQKITSIIKVNYNNTAIRKSRKIVPSMFCYRYTRFDDAGDLENVFAIEIDAKFTEEPFYENFLFEVYVNDIVVAYLDRNSTKNDVGRYIVELVNEEFMNDNNIYVQVRGNYINKFGYEYFFIKELQIVEHFFTPNEELYCGEHIVCNDCIYGFLHDNVFYTERELIDNEYIYDGSVDPISWDGVFIDVPTNIAYDWSSDLNKYQLLYL